ncbi:MAG TPA: PQQ-binding-like beta-propeller repeat protein [Cellvibrio sp.]|nr:PQQ-binding-like beta-propeller repeat protein [Cellvibrio sp.]
MSKFLQRTVLGLCFLFAMVACGGGGGGGGSSNPPASSSAPLDSDKDGVPDSSDAFPNDASETKDTDKDGVGDNSDAFPNDATETKDSDKDGVGDNKDLFPNDATETVDADKDGVGDNSDSTPLGPVIPAWANFRANPQHSGWVDVTLDVSNFKQRWSVADISSSSFAAAADGYVFVNTGDSLKTLDARNGAIRWTQTLGDDALIYSSPAYAAGIVYVITSDFSDSILWAFDAADGKLVFQTRLEQYVSYHKAPIVSDGTVYIGGGQPNFHTGASFTYAVDAKTGQFKWQQLHNNNGFSVPAISGAYTLEHGETPVSLIARDRTTGNVAFAIPDPVSNWITWGALPVVHGDYVLVNHWSRLSAYNLSTRQYSWEVSDAEFDSQPVIKGDRWYIINKGVIEVRSLVTGELVASIRGSKPFAYQLFVTNNLIFVGDETNTYAYNLEDASLAWTLNKKVGALLLAEGALLVVAANGIVAIDVQGELDVDGLPDWWEKRFGKNFDPALDDDADGLSALQEFTLGTHPLTADTDGDALLDGAEVAGKSSPLQKDTDGDGLDDGQEVNTHKTEPSKVDTDGDGFGDAEELAVGFNPLDGQDTFADSDGDGFSNMHEFRANTGLNDINSRPQIGEWTTRYGNSLRNSYNPLLLSDAKFSERWSVSGSGYLRSPVTSAGRLLLTMQSVNRLRAWDSGTGVEIWKRNNDSNSDAYPSIEAGQAIQFYYNSGKGSQNLVVTDAATGNSVLNKSISVTHNFDYAGPLVSNGRIFSIDASSRQIRAYGLADGNLLWSSSLGNQYSGSGYLPLIGNDQLVFIDRDLKVFSTSTGALLKTIDITGLNAQRGVLGSNNNLILNVSSTGALTSVDLTTGNRSWTSSDCDYVDLAVGNGKIYALSSRGELCVIDEKTGALAWEMKVSIQSLSSNIVLTASHLFYSTYSNTYAVDLARKKVTWQLNRGVSALALAADGTLYLVGDSQVTAIDTEGDTDADGLLEWWERRYGGNLDPAADLDQDGLTNLQEFAAKTNPLNADTDSDGLTDSHEINSSLTDPLDADMDKDGLSDGVELNTTNTNPGMLDTDADGLEDSREYAAGLNGSNPNDAALDSDSDGYSNRDEVFGDTDLNDASSKPVAGHWTVEQANVGRTGFQPYKLDEANFSLRWSKTFDTIIEPVVTGNKQVFITHGENGSRKVAALDFATGEQQWQASTAYAGVPGYIPSTNQVAVATNYPQGLQLFDAATGAAASHLPSFVGPLSLSPVVLGESAYSRTSNQIQALNLGSGQALWNIGDLGYGTNRVVLNDQYLFFKQGGQIRVHDRVTGALVSTIDTSSTSYGVLVLGTRNNILDLNGQGIASFNLTTRKQIWSRSAPVQAGYEDYALANGQLYIRESGNVYSINEMTGELSWKQGVGAYGNTNLLATLTHVFVASDAKTYALSATTGEQLWSYDVGGNLALGADGALYIQSGNKLVAINLEGDRDGDEIPDWYERRYGLDRENADDASRDLDGDGLTNLQEFTAGSYANNPDSDADGLSDEEEVHTHHTNPVSADTDMDDLVDYWEINNSLDPRDPDNRDQDLDGDGISNYMEYLADTDPTNALSLPPIFVPGHYSFEDGLLPAGWELSAETTSVQVTTGTASHGSRALELRYQAGISFEGYFMASDLSLDVKNDCDVGYQVQIYIDDQPALSSYSTTSQWTTLKTTIPLGNHKISILSNSYGCEIYVDNVVIAPAISNTQLAVQLVGFDGNFLKFVSVDGKVVRTLAIKAPLQTQQLVSIVSAGNNKLALAYQGNNRNSFLRLLDLTTFNWRDFTNIDSIASSTSAVATRDNFAYLPTYDSHTGSGHISRVNLSTGATTRFGSHHYSALAVDSAGFIYAHSNGVVYKYDPSTLAFVSKVATINAQQLLFDSKDRLIVVSHNEVARYNAQRAIDAQIKTDYVIHAVALDAQDQLFIGLGPQLARYTADWKEMTPWAVPVMEIASLTVPDSDGDGLPDWWEMARGFDIADSADASVDGDSDGLTAREEFMAHTDPSMDDTDGDLLKDGDEVANHRTNPLNVDTDGDHLTDAEEINQYSTNPLLADTDADGIDDYREHAPVLVNFTDSFEGSVTRWVTSVDANAGWTVVDDKASSGSKSLRSGPIGHRQKAAVEMFANFNQSTLTFDAWVSSESSYDNLLVYVDGVLESVTTAGEQWYTKSIAISAGFHTVQFVYQKDWSGVGGSDTVWIDNIRIQ